MVIFRAFEKRKLQVYFCALWALAACFAAGDDARAQSGQICVPNAVSGCKICNFAGTDWINDNLKCASGQICLNGECVANCQNECQLAGIKECYAGGYRVCVNNENTGCLHWSGVFPCLPAETCAGGICVKNQTASAESIALSNFSPFGVINEKNITLKVATSVVANCRYDFLDRDFNLMPQNFATANYLAHSAPLALEKAGDYVYYVRCRDKNGNVVAGNIAFTYLLPQTVAIKDPKNPEVVPQVVKTPPGLDKQPPVISAASPSGKINLPEIELSLLTDEAASCNYDVFDTDYESMENSMIASDGGLTHRHKIILANSGKYVYYVRCADKAGNKNPSSAKISFEYNPSKTAAELEITNLSPGGAVYQNELMLMLATQNPADCRYGTAEAEFGEMTEDFGTADRFLHEVAVSLPGYGRYDYFARCKDESGAINKDAVRISFEYRELDIDMAQYSSNNGCAEYSLSDEDGDCDYRQDCVCDPDCKKTGEYDPDCDNIAAPQKDTRPLIVWGAAVFGIFVVIAAIIFVFKKIKKSPAAPTDESQLFG